MACVADQYDFCIIDNAPDINVSTINALTACDDVLIPVEIDDKHNGRASGIGESDWLYKRGTEPRIEKLLGLYHKI